MGSSFLFLRNIVVDAGLFLSLLAMMVSGAGMEEAFESKTAVAGLSGGQWKEVHEHGVLIFMIFVAAHLLLNGKVLLHRLRSLKGMGHPS